MILYQNIIAFDFGLKKIGIAVGQLITCTSNPLSTIKVKNGKPDFKKIKKVMDEWNPYLLVVGLPLNMDGTEQFITKKTRNFSKILNKYFKIKVELHDERLSTVEARNRIFEQGGYRHLKKRNLDSDSAVIILESWLKQIVQLKSKNQLNLYLNK